MKSTTKLTLLSLLAATVACLIAYHEAPKKQP